MDDTTRTIRGAGVTLAGQWSGAALRTVGLAILARILVPADFGLWAMITAISGIAFVVGDLGLSLASIQSRRLTAAQRNALFWLNTGIGATVAAVLFAAAPLIAAFYDEPRLTALTRALTITFLLGGISTQPRADLARSMRFTAMAVTDVIAVVISLSGAIAIALAGAGAWALIAQQVLYTLCIALTSLLLTRFVPRWPRRGVGLRQFVSFGLFTSATQVVNYVSSNVDTIALGRFQGPSVAGVYSRAFQIFMLPLQQLVSPMTKVVLPLLSRAGAGAGFAHLASRLQLAICYLVLGPLLLIACCPAAVISIMLGSQWTSGSVLLATLAVGGAFQAMGYVYYWLFLARAHMHTLLLCELPGRILMTGAIIWAATNSAQWVAIAVSAGLAAVWLTTSLAGLRTIGISFLALAHQAGRPLAIYLTAALVTAALSRWVLPWPGASVWTLVCGAMVFAGVLGLAAAVSRQVRGDLSVLYRAGLSLLGRRAMAA